MTELFEVGVVGTGYVGLTTGACLAHIGHRVTCVDNNAQMVAELREGRIPFYEPGLEELVERGVRDDRLRFSTDLAPLVGEAASCSSPWARRRARTALMSKPSLLVDGRNALDPELAMAAGLRYRGFGHG